MEVQSKRELGKVVFTIPISQQIAAKIVKIEDLRAKLNELAIEKDRQPNTPTTDSTKHKDRPVNGRLPRKRKPLPEAQSALFEVIDRLGVDSSPAVAS